MTKYDKIIAKLEGFIRKYYTNELLKGALLFFAIGVLYFLLTVSFEFFFWLGKTGRLILFWLFVAVEIGLFARFIVFPLLKLLKLSKGIGYEEASRIIGKHFPEVSDKLLNVLQLKRNGQAANSELVLASIDQKSEELQPVPFQIAVNFKTNLKYLKYAAIPILIILAIWISGESALFSDSYSRVVNYEEAYEPPAPFSFQILNSKLNIKENESFNLHVKTQGKVIPQNAKIHFNGETYLLKSGKPGEFTYTFDKLKKSTQFSLSANEVRSRPYELRVINVPTLLGFQMHVHFPNYLNKTDKTIKGTGNATIPEGTKISWDLQTKTTDKVKLELPDTTKSFQKNASDFSIDQAFYRNTYYKITTANRQVKDYEKLSYQLKVVKDKFPEINVEMKKDTVNGEELYFHGQVSDDYGLRRLRLVYYPIKDSKQKKFRSIAVSRSNFDDFVYAFPDTLQLDAGKAYEFYFQVFDNDGVNGSKATKSQTFGYRKLTEDEEEEKQLNDQKQTINGMNNSLEKMKDSNKELQELNQMQKEKSKLSYNDRKKFENYLKRQEQQNKLMKNYSKKMKKDLEDFQKKDKSDADKKALKERMERNEKRLEKNEKLMKELQKYQDKINKEQMAKKLEKLAKNNKNQQRSLEELLELTKRYYVQKKAERIASDLKKLAKEQDQLSKKDKENTSESQKRLNKKFNQIKKDLDSLQKENQGLQKPMELGRDKPKEKSVQKDQSDATKKLEDAEKKSGEKKENASEKSSEKSSEQKKGEQQSGQKSGQQSKSGAQKKQQSAAEKMKQMTQGMQMQMQMGSAQQQAEDAKMLRQVLDNLVTFSVQQEDLMEDFKEMDDNSPNFANKLKYQQTLKENFEHVDDSLYALALRNPIISDKITSKLTDIDFNIDKALERIAQNNIRTGVSSQQYVFTGANDLANMLDNALQQMQMMMQANGSGQGKGSPKPGQGQGKGRGFQLPDIIQKQEGLNKQMQNGQKKGGQKKGDKPGGKKPGQQGKKGQQGKSGKSGQKGKSGKQGKNGKSGRQGNGGKNGKLNKNGQVPSSEKMSEEIYQIYKEQQKLRFQLHDLIEKQGLGENAKSLERQMQQVEQKMLRQGFTQQTEEQMIHIKQQMLQLKNASFKQKQENKRESKTNTKVYQNNSKENLKKAKDYFNTTEILNRQSLPLRQNYKVIVQDYFKQTK